MITLNSEERVRKGAEKLSKFLNAKQQGRLDGFFTAKPKTSPKKDAKGKDDVKKGAKRKVGKLFNSSFQYFDIDTLVFRAMTRRRDRVKKPRRKNDSWFSVI
jgi:hypothetical protein